MALLSLRALLACLVLAATVCPSWQQKSKVVEFAPEADLENGDDDISAKGELSPGNWGLAKGGPRAPG